MKVKQGLSHDKIESLEDAHRHHADPDLAVITALEGREGGWRLGRNIYPNSYVISHMFTLGNGSGSGTTDHEPNMTGEQQRPLFISTQNALNVGFESSERKLGRGTTTFSLHRNQGQVQNVKATANGSWVI